MFGDSPFSRAMDGRVLLLQELTARKNRNSAYSLRAFARDLGVSPAALSQYLLRKREFSKKNRLSVAERLKLSPLEQRSFENVPSERPPVESHEMISEDAFRMISDWASVAIMNLARLKTNQSSPKWIAKRLVISVHEADEALKRLQRLGLIQTKQGRMVRTGKPFSTSSDIPSEAIKKFHLSLLQKAQESVLEIPVELRDLTAIIMPTDPQRLEQAKQILKRARRRVADLLSTSRSKEVYVLAQQLYPLTRNTDEGESE